MFPDVGRYRTVPPSKEKHKGRRGDLQEQEQDATLNFIDLCRYIYVTPTLVFDASGTFQTSWDRDIVRHLFEQTGSQVTGDMRGSGPETL